ncbi:MAG: 3-alpha,7-alpha,12-alpha-trihydroxy-5-beta-cholest-24-enoyl-CoA hydratase [Deltaproteobacteria bacterium]|nr:MAG: 3-alpha,7-alpha,12-alpha-trihydroxy-5-beta-cholest-24-enoyl-CoA hydratase [Deltaproteobacteria bacterium]
MAIDYVKLKHWAFEDVEQTYSEKDSMLYALGLGFGHDPLDEMQLRFVYEKDLVAVPTMAVVLGSPGFWLKDPATGVDWVQAVHGEHSLTLHKPLPSAGTVIGRLRVSAIVDKGKDKGALLVQERTLHDKESGDVLATIEHLTFCRGDGGFSGIPGNGPKGGDPAPAAKPGTPDALPDAVCDLPTLPQAALLYRLNSDYNPLHADPSVARAAGFVRPILHGLCTYGVAGRSILKTYCGYDPGRFLGLGARFSAPVFPGETIRTEMWRRGDTVHFRSRAIERNVVVLSSGVAKVAS